MSYVSTLRPGDLILDDNQQKRLLAEMRSGTYGTGYEPRDYSVDGYGSVGEPMPESLLIPRSEWPDRIEALEKEGRTTTDICKARRLWFKNQGQLPYCWIFCVAHAVEVLRAVQGQGMVSLSPASVGGPVTGYVKRGGWPTKGLEYVVKHGFVPSSMWPDTAVDRRYQTAEADATRRNYSVTEWYDIPANISKRQRFDYVASLVLRNIPVPVAHMHLRHAMLAVDLVRQANGRYALRERNSWGNHKSTMLIDETFGVDEACAPRVATAA